MTVDPAIPPSSKLILQTGCNTHNSQQSVSYQNTFLLHHEVTVSGSEDIQLHHAVGTAAAAFGLESACFSSSPSWRLHTHISQGAIPKSERALYSHSCPNQQPLAQRGSLTAPTNCPLTCHCCCCCLCFRCVQHRTQWHDLIEHHCPRFGQTRLVSVSSNRRHCVDEKQCSCLAVSMLAYKRGSAQQLCGLWRAGCNPYSEARGPAG